MRRSLLLALAAVGMAGEPASGQQRNRAASPAATMTFVSVCSAPARPLQEASPTPPPGAALEHYCGDAQLRGMVRSEDLTGDLGRRRFQGTTLIELDVSPEGTATACTIARPSGEPRLDRLACSLISSRARFRPLYAAPGRRIAARHDLMVGWRIAETPPPPHFVVPAPPQPAEVDFSRPRAWPRLTWWSPLELVALPSIQAGYPAAAPSGGTVGLDLLVRAETGIESCEVGVSSGNSALDEAACRVARTIELRYSSPCDRCVDSIVPLQVIWRREGGSHIRYPLPIARIGRAPPMDPADTRSPDARRAFPVPVSFTVTPEDYRRIGDRKVTNPRPMIAVGVGANGRAQSCRPRISSGNPAVDQRSCELILERARYRPQTDIFGDAVATPSHTQVLTLPPLE